MLVKPVFEGVTRSTCNLLVLIIAQWQIKCNTIYGLVIKLDNMGFITQLCVFYFNSERLIKLL